MLRLFLVLCLVAQLLGCAISPLDQNASPGEGGESLSERGYVQMLQPWVGKNVQELVAEWGPPFAVYDIERSPNKRYTFIREAGELIYAGQRVPASCATTFVVDPSGILTHFYYNGNACKAKGSSPNTYAGPAATITGRGFVEDATTMQWFVIAEISPGNVLPSRCGATATTRGAAVSARCVGQEIVARPMRIKIRGSYVSDTPAQAAARKEKGAFLFVEGVVDFSPVPGGNYLVTGELKKGRSSVWIEDVMTKQPVTKVIVQE